MRGRMSLYANLPKKEKEKEKEKEQV